MTSTRWFACLLSLAVSTQTVWGQPSYPSPSSYPPTSAEPSAPFDPAAQLRMQFETYLRQMQHMNGPGNCPATECTRPQYGPPCGQQPTISEEELKFLIQGAVRQQQSSREQDASQTAYDNPPQGAEQADWCCQLNHVMNNWFHAWQRSSCLMSQAASAAVAACEECSGQAKDCTAGTCPFAAPCAQSAGDSTAKNTIRLTVRAVGQLPGCGVSDRMIIRAIDATDSTFQLTPEAIRWLREQGVSDQVIIHMALRPQIGACTGTCPFAQVAKAGSRNLCSAEMVQMIKALQSCFSSTCQGGTCCQEGANVVVAKGQAAPGLTWQVRILRPAAAKTAQEADAPATGPTCPFAQFYPSAQPSTTATPSCCRATADKAGCCDNCKCKTCDKCNGASHDPYEVFWTRYQEVLSKFFGFPVLHSAKPSCCQERSTHGELPVPHLPFGGGCPFCPEQCTNNGCPMIVPPVPFSGSCPYCPAMGAPACGKCPVMGPVPPPPPAFHMPVPFTEGHPDMGQRCPWLNGTMAFPGAPFAGMMPPHPGMGVCPPPPGMMPPGCMPPFGAVGSGVQWPVPHPNCVMPGAVNPWGGPFVIYHEVPNGDLKQPMQPVAIPAPCCTQAPVAACQQECKIVAKDGVVHLTTSHIEARCSTITTGNRDHVVLEGDVHLVYKKGNDTTRIEAPRVIVNLNQGTFTVEAGSGTAPVNACPISIQDVMKFWPSIVY